MQDIHKIRNSQRTLHTSPSRASYEVSFVNILEKIGHLITDPIVWNAPENPKPMTYYGHLYLSPPKKNGALRLLSL